MAEKKKGKIKLNRIPAEKSKTGWQYQ